MISSRCSTIRDPRFLLLFPLYRCLEWTASHRGCQPACPGVPRRGTMGDIKQLGRARPVLCIRDLAPSWRT
jgi:hypothetical protein